MRIVGLFYHLSVENGKLPFNVNHFPQKNTEKLKRHPCPQSFSALYRLQSPSIFTIFTGVL